MSGERVLYSLYGIVEHSGSMRGGHYTAYVKVRAPQRPSEQPRRNQPGEGCPSPHNASFSFSFFLFVFLRRRQPLPPSSTLTLKESAFEARHTGFFCPAGRCRDVIFSFSSQGEREAFHRELKCSRMSSRCTVSRRPCWLIR